MLGYTPGSAYFTLVNNSHNYADLACTPNTFHVGIYLDEIASHRDGRSGRRCSQALDQVSNDEACLRARATRRCDLRLDRADRRAEHDDLHPDAGQSVASRRIGWRRHTRGRRQRRLRRGDGQLHVDQRRAAVDSRHLQPGNRWNTWATGFGLGGNARTDGNAAGLDYSMGGTLAGLEAADSCNLVGFYGGYLYNYIGTNANESNQINGGTFGSYYVTSLRQSIHARRRRLRVRRLRQPTPHLLRRRDGRRRYRRLERLLLR